MTPSSERPAPNKIQRGKKCEVCDKKLTKNDYYQLCRRCQPAFQLGRRHGIAEMTAVVTGAIAEIRP